MYHPQYGLIDYALAKVGVKGPDWLGDPHWALAAIILMSVWKNFGYNMLIFIAGLQSIPGELYDAANVDGAGPVRQFTNVTLPMLGPTLLFVGVITMIGYFQLFAEPYVMTQGGPLRSTTSVVLLMYEEGFRWWRMGYAAAIAFVLFVVILLATLVQFRLQRDRQ
jgi:multiple sugar transport system permease protein